jgi:hypothetical protein
MRGRYPPAPERLNLEQIERLAHLAGHFDDEAVRCADAGADWAACLIVACALEALLLANVLVFEPDVEREGTWPARKKLPEQWHLSELIRSHVDHGWIAAGDPDPRNPKLGDALGKVEELRDAVAHPGRLNPAVPRLRGRREMVRGRLLVPPADV